MRKSAGALGTFAIALALLPASAHAAFAPPSQEGPKLEISKADRKASLRCTATVENAKRKPVLLLPATGVTSRQNFDFNWEPALRRLGIPYCTSDQAGELETNLDDIQTRGEYVVYAIREMYRRAGRKVATLGHSQGGMVTRWALRFWPDTRKKVNEVIGLAPSNHGTLDSEVLCALPACNAAFWQQSASANFVRALNSFKETFRGISYTNVYTHTDWVVVPNLDDSGSSSLRTGNGRISNIAIQDICPLDVNEHLLIGTIDPVAYELAIDALTHPGPAKEGRIGGSVCGKLFMPGVNPATAATDVAASAAALVTNIATYPQAPREPPLRCYVTGTCKK